jgi:polar amino acid transport system substrate-binding protein
MEIKFMKFIKKILIIVLINLTATAYSAPLIFQSTDTPPYWSSELPDNGIGGALLKLFSQAAGIEYSINYLPVTRFRQSLAPSLVGDPDLLLHQKHLAIYPIGTYWMAFFYHKAHHQIIDFKNVSNLKGYTLGVLRGTLEDKEYFVKNKINIDESDTVESLLRKLQRGRIDFCILVEGTGRYNIEKLFPKEKSSFVREIIPSMVRPLTIMIDLDAPEGVAVAERYRQVMTQTMHSPEYRSLIESFYGNSAIPEARQERLRHFIQYYKSTWSK